MQTLGIHPFFSVPTITQVKDAYWMDYYMFERIGFGGYGEGKAGVDDGVPTSGYAWSKEDTAKFEPIADPYTWSTRDDKWVKKKN